MTPLCPCCNKPLLSHAVRVKGQFLTLVYCGYGRCRSSACNQEHLGKTVAEAVKALEMAYEQEQIEL